MCLEIRSCLKSCLNICKITAIHKKYLMVQLCCMEHCFAPASTIQSSYQSSIGCLFLSMMKVCEYRKQQSASVHVLGTRAVKTAE